MIGAVLVALLAEELLLDFDAAALDQHQLIALAALAGGADVDLAGGVDRGPRSRSELSFIPISPAECPDSSASSRPASCCPPGSP